MDANSKAADAAAPEVDPIAELVDKWHSESFHGTALGNHTELWNLVHHAKDDLKQRLAKALEK